MIVRNKRNNTCVYFHINPLKNEIFYVGIGNPNVRPFDKKLRSVFWKRTANKYGFIVDIIETNLTWKNACKREKFYINKIGRRDLGLGPLVNLTNGGDGTHGTKLSNETKAKISKAQKGKIRSKETKQKMSEAFKGRIYSKQTRKKMSKSAKLRPPISEITRNKLIKLAQNQKHKPDRNYYSKSINQYDLNNNFIREWKSGCEIYRVLKLNKMGISDCCNNKIKSYKGFIWKFK